MSSFSESDNNYNNYNSSNSSSTTAMFRHTIKAKKSNNPAVTNIMLEKDDDHYSHKRHGRFGISTAVFRNPQRLVVWVVLVLVIWIAVAIPVQQQQQQQQHPWMTMMMTIMERKTIPKLLPDNIHNGPQAFNAVISSFVKTKTMQGEDHVVDVDVDDDDDDDDGEYQVIKVCCTIDRVYELMLQKNFVNVIDFCKQMKAAALEKKNKKKQVVWLEFNCQEAYERGKVGTGNLLNELFNLRLAGLALGTVDFVFKCNDKNLSTAKQLVLPWVMGYFPYSSSSSAGSSHYRPKNFPQKEDAQKEICDNPQAPLNWLVHEIQVDLRRLAIAHVGIPSATHASAAWIKEYYKQQKQRKQHRVWQQAIPHQASPWAAPYYPNVTLDDAVIHFRCGDILVSGNIRYSYLKYAAFAKRIHPSVQRIGILTQPFQDGNNNNNNNNNSEQTLRQRDSTVMTMGSSSSLLLAQKRCKALVQPLAAYLQHKFPLATISIHSRDTISLAYARMIMANQSFSVTSSFSVFATLSTFGTGYIAQPRYWRPHINAFLTVKPRIPELHPNIQFMGDEDLNTFLMQYLWQVDYLDNYATTSTGSNTNATATTTTTTTTTTAQQHAPKARGHERILQWFQDERVHYKNPFPYPDNIQNILQYGKSTAPTTTTTASKKMENAKGKKDINKSKK